MSFNSSSWSYWFFFSHLAKLFHSFDEESMELKISLTVGSLLWSFESLKVLLSKWKCLFFPNRLRCLSLPNVAKKTMRGRSRQGCLSVKIGVKLCVDDTCVFLFRCDIYFIWSLDISLKEEEALSRSFHVSLWSFGSKCNEFFCVSLKAFHFCLENPLLTLDSVTLVLGVQFRVLRHALIPATYFHGGFIFFLLSDLS